MARQQSKEVHEKHQAILSKLLKDDDNKYCVDCDAKGPRWASWNLGVFLCIRCAGIHRNLGVHISKVKSINLDSWTPEQIASVEDMGNSRARAVYEANLPDHYKRPSSSDSAMEQFIRAKYEHKKYIAKEWIPSKPRAVPSHYYDVEKDPKKETKKQTKTILTIPGAASGTTAATKSVKVERTTLTKKQEPAPSLMVDLSSPAKQQVNGSSNPPTSSADLLADIFSTPVAPAPSAASAQTDLFGMSASPQPASTQQQSGEDSSQDLFKIGDEKGQSAKDSIMALFGNTPNPQPNMMSNSFNMPTAYGQQQMMYSNGAMMGTSYPQAQQAGGMHMMGGYSMAGQQPSTMMTSQQGMMGNIPQQGMMGNNMQQGMMGNTMQQGMMGQMMPQQGMMGNMQQQGMVGNTQQQNMYTTQQLQMQMANLSFNQQQMGGMSQGAVATGNAGASWGGSSSLNNGQTLNHNLWN